MWNWEKSPICQVGTQKWDIWVMVGGWWLNGRTSITDWHGRGVMVWKFAHYLSREWSAIFPFQRKDESFYSQTPLHIKCEPYSSYMTMNVSDLEEHSQARKNPSNLFVWAKSEEIDEEQFPGELTPTMMLMVCHYGELWKYSTTRAAFSKLFIWHLTPVQKECKIWSIRLIYS